MKVDVECPKCHSAKLEQYRLPHWTLLHWVLNPAIAFNELVLGQRIPKYTLICTHCQLPLPERQYIPCPSCGSINDWLIWARKTKYRFGKWLGLVCPVCGERIPCLWNLTSLIIIYILFPIWYPFYFFYFKNRKVKKPAILNGEKSPTIANRSVLSLGLSWSLLMWIIMSAIPGVWNYWNTGYLEVQKILLEAGVWLIAGMFVGLVEHSIYNKKGEG
jgi:hypothetical protein